MEFLAHSLFQYMFVDVFYDAPMRNAIIKLFTSVISLLVVVPAWQSALRVVNKNDQYYSKWHLVGGNCPLPVGSCQHLDYVGCGLNSTLGIAPKDPNIIDTATTSASGSTSEESGLSLSGASSSSSSPCVYPRDEIGEGISTTRLWLSKRRHGSQRWERRSRRGICIISCAPLMGSYSAGRSWYRSHRPPRNQTKIHLRGRQLWAADACSNPDPRAELHRR